MFVLGKKCPQCGATDLIQKQGRGSGAANATPGRYLCLLCGQSINHRLFFSFTDEQRRKPRRKMPSTFLVRIHDQQEQYARITDISPLGIGFISGMGGELLAGRKVLVDLFNCDDGSSLEQLPVEVLASRLEHRNATPGSQSVVRNNARFAELNQAQFKVLTNCIERYSLPIEHQAQLKQV